MRKPKLTRVSAALAACGLLASGTGLAAESPISANVALTSDYVFRGVSQTLEDPAIQGGFDYSHASGFYLGVWGSNVDFGGPEHLEVDLYGGWSTELKSGLGVDLGIISYQYFDDPGDISFEELYAGLSYKIFSAKLSYDPDNKNSYIEAGLDYELPEGFGLAVHVGNSTFDADFAPGVDSYTDWSAGVSKEWGGFGFALTYYDTDSDGETFAGDNASSRVVFAVSKSM